MTNIKVFGRPKRYWKQQNLVVKMSQVFVHKYTRFDPSHTGSAPKCAPILMKAQTHKSLFTHNSVNNMCKCIYTRALTLFKFNHGEQSERGVRAGSFSSHSERHIIIFSLWTPSQGKLLCFSGGELPVLSFVSDWTVFFLLPSLQHFSSGVWNATPALNWLFRIPPLLLSVIQH